MMSRRGTKTTVEEPFARITIGSDGRIYWHELTPELLEIASALCGEDAALQRRIAVSIAAEGDHEHHASAS